MLFRSQRPHVFLNPTQSQGGELELPFFYDRNCLDIPNRDWADMGELVIASLQDLQHANGSTAPISYSVFAWAENVTYSTPTRSVPNVVVARAVPEGGDEHMSGGVISKPATTVAKIAGTLKNIPMISPFARATEIGAKAVSAMASLFGYSSPVDLATTQVIPKTKRSLATTDDKNDCQKLTVDSKQELTLDPRTTGLEGWDELPINAIATRESYFNSFNWKISDNAEKHLWNCRVDPLMVARNGSEYHLTASAFAVYPFEFWRGSLRYRFQIVSSEYHKGRIRVVWDPDIGSATSPYNTAYSEVIDIATQKDFTIDIGWGQPDPFRRKLALTDVSFSTIPLDTGLIDSKANGILSVYVVNELTSPSDVVVNDIQINVFVSALDDFEVAAPNDDLRVIRDRPPPVVASRLPVPEGGSAPIDADEPAVDEVTDPPVIGDMGALEYASADTNKTFFGEVIGSFRQLLKRDYLTETVIYPILSDTSVISMSRPLFPQWPGYTLNPADGTSTFETAGGTYQYAGVTLLHYLSLGFLGFRGGVRYTFDTSKLASTSNLNVVTRVNRSQASSFSNTITTLADAGTLGDLQYATWSQNPHLGPMKGASLWSTTVNPIQTVEVPYYSNRRFNLIAEEKDQFAGQIFGPTFNLQTTLNASTIRPRIDVFCSAGEDFNFFFWAGVPPLYTENLLPQPLPPPP